MTIEDKRKVAKSEKNSQLIVAPKKQKIEIIKKNYSFSKLKDMSFQMRTFYPVLYYGWKKKILWTKKVYNQKNSEALQEKKKNQMTYNCK